MRPGRVAAWLAVLALALAPLGCPPPPRPASARLRILGPFAELGAQLAWLRFQAALANGEEARALELAEQALALDPGSTEGWQTLAAHLAFDLASREREPELARRRAFFAAGLSVLARGAEHAERPAELEFFRALALVGKAALDPELDPGGAPALRLAAAEAFERAASLGEQRAQGLAAQLRAENAE